MNREKSLKILISPAKKMVQDPYSAPADSPKFLHETEKLLAALRAMTPAALEKLWGCSPKLTEENLERLSAMDLSAAQTPALFSYQGLQYQHMAQNVFTEEQQAYLQEHLRILSGFYGVLRPFDGVVPYRLEMQAKLSVGEKKNLYQFWGNKLADSIAEEATEVLDLASKEYSKAVVPHLQSTPVIRCVFGEKTEKGIVEKGTLCKMARGEMVRWLAENRIICGADAAAFPSPHYCFSKDDSTEDTLVFLRT